MTLKEFLNKKLIPIGYSFYVPDIGYVSLEDIITEFTELKLKEQREICSEKATTYSDAGGYTFVDNDSILNAPIPDL